MKNSPEKYIITVILILFVITNSILGQNPNIIQGQYKFKYITVDQGLSNNHVNAICQDSRGFLWFATQYGVNSFDGHKITLYIHDPKDSTSISSNDVRVVYADSKGNIWVGNTGGLDLYNAEEANFIRFKHKSLSQPIVNVDDIIEDKEGKLWIGALNGLYVFNLNTEELNKFNHKEDEPNGLLSDHVFTLMADSKNRIWISCFFKGICLYDQNDETFTCFKTDPKNKNSISDIRIERIYEDKSGRIWIGTYNGGLNLFNPEDKSFTRIIPDSENPYSTRVRAIFEDMQGNFFVGTRGGLYMLDKTDNTFFTYSSREHHFSKLSQNSILCSFIDKTGSLWLGTYAGGVNYTDLYRKMFIHFPPGKEDPYFLNGADVYAITEDPEGNLWIGTGNGLNKLNRKDYTFEHYVNIPGNPNSLSYNDIKAFEWDSKGNLWIGTNKGGLDYLNISTGKFKHYKHDIENPNSISNDKIYGLLRDKEDNLWILSNSEIDNQYSDIDILPSGKREFIHLNEKGYFGIIQGQGGNIYLGSINGYIKFSPKDSVFSFITNESYIGKVNTLLEGSKGTLWIGSEKGLMSYNEKSNTIHHYSEDNNCPIGIVYGLLEDNSNNLWISTNIGLIKMMNKDDPENVKFKLFDKEDGLQSRQFNFNAYCKLKSEEMAFGGINGFNLFFPEEIQNNPIKPNVVLTNLKVFDKSVSVGEIVNGRMILEKPVDEMKEIVLDWRHKVFTIEFASLHFSNPDRNMFMYILEGFNKNWQITDATKGFATYTNLDGELYTFKVKAANQDGVWGDDIAELKIKVIPPFWKTLWFKMSVVFSILVIIITYYFYRINQIKRQKLRLEALVKQRTIEIEEKNYLLIEQASQLNETNTLLEERQTHIEEQAEELKTQKDKLVMQAKALEKINAELNETNVNLEERHEEIEYKTEQLEVQKEQLQDINKQLNELILTKDKFFSIIAHDLRNPFQTIVGFVELLKLRYDRLTEEKKARYIDLVFAATNNTYNLLENLLNWARSQTGNLVFKPEVINIEEIVKNNISLLRTIFEKKGIKIKTHFNGHSEVLADKNMVDTIIRNIVSNALKFTHNGGKIEIRTEDYSDNMMKVTVKDDGIGMSEECLKKLFSIGISSSRTGTGGETGTGLGLILCKEFVIKNRGEIWVESEKGKGTEFFFTLPLSS